MIFDVELILYRRLYYHIQVITKNVSEVQDIKKHYISIQLILKLIELINSTNKENIENIIKFNKKYKSQFNLF